MINQFDNFEREYTITNIIEFVLDLTNKWEFENKAGCPWFRGQDREKAPLPALFREKYDEFHMNTTFRNRSGALYDIPDTNRIDQWLFLMQHYGLPTRLLDWTESLLNALFFALDGYNELCECKREVSNPTLWALHPLKLNEFTKIENDFPNTWSRHNDKNGINQNPGIEHFRLGFHPEKDWKCPLINLEIVKYPIAIHANFLDLRIFSQQSCFTINGKKEEDFETIFNNTDLINNDYFLKFVIPNQYAKKLLNELECMGYNTTKIFPDIEHFAKDLLKRFKS